MQQYIRFIILTCATTLAPSLVSTLHRTSPMPLPSLKGPRRAAMGRFNARSAARCWHASRATLKSRALGTKPCDANQEAKVLAEEEVEEDERKLRTIRLLRMPSEIMPLFSEFKGVVGMEGGSLHPGPSGWKEDERRTGPRPFFLFLFE
jgi:hypothetical protein